MNQKLLFAPLAMLSTLITLTIAIPNANNTKQNYQLAATAKESSLTFNWKPGLRGKTQVLVKGYRTVSTEGKTAWDFNASYDMQVKQRGDNLLIERTNFSGWKGKMPPQMIAGVDRLVDLIPTFVVSRTGNFLNIEGAETAKSRFISIRRSPGGLSATNQPLIDAVTSPQGLKSIAQDYWAGVVESWQGSAPPVGKTNKLRNTTSVPQLGGGTLDVIVEFKNLGVVACNNSDTAKKCLQLVIQSQPDRQQVQQIINRLVPAMKASGTTISRYDSLNEIKLITEPETLLPYRVTFKRKIDLDLRVQNRVVNSSEENTRTYIYRYL